MNEHMSAEHLQYIKRIKRDRVLVVIFRILVLFSFSAIDSIFSPDNNSSIDTEKYLDISFKESILG